MQPSNNLKILLQPEQMHSARIQVVLAEQVQEWCFISQAAKRREFSAKE